MSNINPTTIAIGALATLMILVNSFFIVDQREYAVKFQVGELLKEATYAPGIHAKIPFYQSVRKFDARLLTLDNQTENFLTGEKKNVEVSFYEDSQEQLMRDHRRALEADAFGLHGSVEQRMRPIVVPTSESQAERRRHGPVPRTPEDLDGCPDRAARCP